MHDWSSSDDTNSPNDHQGKPDEEQYVDEKKLKDSHRYNVCQHYLARYDRA
jgi:hypothetical protein